MVRKEFKTKRELVWSDSIFCNNINSKVQGRLQFLVSKGLTKSLHSEFMWLRGTTYPHCLWLMPICLVLISVYVFLCHLTRVQCNSH